MSTAISKCYTYVLYPKLSGPPLIEWSSIKSAFSYWHLQTVIPDLLCKRDVLSCLNFLV